MYLALKNGKDFDQPREQGFKSLPRDLVSHDQSLELQYSWRDQQIIMTSTFTTRTGLHQVARMNTTVSQSEMTGLTKVFKETCLHVVTCVYEAVAEAEPTSS